MEWPIGRTGIVFRKIAGVILCPGETSTEENAKQQKPGKVPVTMAQGRQIHALIVSPGLPGFCVRRTEPVRWIGQAKNIAQPKKYPATLTDFTYILCVSK
ncbi:MAG: hypothetical protein ABI142_09910 [Bryocella sp.]